MRRHNTLAKPNGQHDWPDCRWEEICGRRKGKEMMGGEGGKGVMELEKRSMRNGDANESWPGVECGT